MHNSKVLDQFEDPFFRKEVPEKEPELDIYGHKLFAYAPTTFDPIRAVPVRSDGLMVQRRWIQS